MAITLKSTLALVERVNKLEKTAIELNILFKCKNGGMAFGTNTGSAREDHGP